MSPLFFNVILLLLHLVSTVLQHEQWRLTVHVEEQWRHGLLLLLLLLLLHHVSTGEEEEGGDGEKEGEGEDHVSTVLLRE